MPRSVVGKVVWLARGAAIFWEAALTLALLLGMATMALGATGANFILGRANTAETIARLTANIAGPALRVVNTSTDSAATALDLQVASGKPPIKVNSTAKVVNLNADRVDSKSAEDLSRVAVTRATATTPIPTDGTEVTYGQPLSITAPADGFVRVNGTVTITNAGCTSTCTFTASVRHIEGDARSLPQYQDVPEYFGNAGLDEVFPVDKGVNTFDIRVARFSDSGELDGFYGELTAECTPYGPTGSGALNAAGAKNASRVAMENGLPSKR